VRSFGTVHTTNVAHTVRPVQAVQVEEGQLELISPAASLTFVPHRTIACSSAPFAIELAHAFGPTCYRHLLRGNAGLRRRLLVSRWTS
jgi:hypothetical protein